MIRRVPNNRAVSFQALVAHVPGAGVGAGAAIANGANTEPAGGNGMLISGGDDAGGVNEAAGGGN